MFHFSELFGIVKGSLEEVEVMFTDRGISTATSGLGPQLSWLDSLEENDTSDSYGLDIQIESRTTELKGSSKLIHWFGRA